MAKAQKAKRLPKKWVQVRAKILAACARGKKAGVMLVPRNFGQYVPGGACCPISMVAGPGDHETWTFTAAQKLGITDAQVWAFISGFDGTYTLGRLRGGPAYLVGRQVRAKLLPQS